MKIGDRSFRRYVNERKDEDSKVPDLYGYLNEEEQAKKETSRKASKK